MYDKQRFNSTVTELTKAAGRRLSHLAVVRKPTRLGWVTLLTAGLSALLLAGSLARVSTITRAPLAAKLSVNDRGQPSVADFLNPDGSVKLGSGFSGSLDVRGFRMEHTASGAPRFVPAAWTVGCDGDGNWDAQFNLPGSNGVNGTVWAVAVNGNELYVGGDFMLAGTVNVNCLARWDGRNWSALGSGVNNTVHALAVLGNELYAGGDFTQAGEMNASFIARWNISSGSWSTLGSGVNSGVYALAVKGSELYVGGFFTTAGGSGASRIAKWSNNSWSALGNGVADGPLITVVFALAVLGDDLYGGGSFTTAGGGSAKYIARWNTLSNGWFSLGSGASNGVSDFVRALAVSGSNLYVGGDFGGAGGMLAPGVARWNGSSWAALGSGISGGVYALAVSGNYLYAGGTFGTVGGTSADKLALWHIPTSTWTVFDTGANGNVYALAAIGNDVIDPDLVACGEFTNISNVDVNHLAFWNGANAWSAVGSGNGVNNDVNVLAVNGSDVYVGGYFTMAGTVNASRIARWNGRTWSPLSGGVNGHVNALAIIGNDLYVGGEFTNAGVVSALNIARWNISNGSWTALGLGVSEGVNALAVDGSNLYVGGGFATAGGVEANRIARWNGSWASVGSGANNGVNSTVYALAMSGGKLYVGGLFTMAGTVSALRIACWNGSSWAALGSGLNDDVRALVVNGSDLFVGGEFTMAGTMSALHIARWNGSSWAALGSGVNNKVYALALSGSDLYAGGNFTAIGGIQVLGVAKWDGNNWAALGSGVNGGVFALAVSGGYLYAGGEFNTAGGKPSNRFGRYSIHAFTPRSAAFPGNSGMGTPALTGTINVTLPADCNWTATSNDSFITITAGQSGSGSGTVSYALEPNPSNTTRRTGTITIGSQTFTVLQGPQFFDVATDHQFYTFIGKLAARAVTLGCGGGNYCPESSVTREQMAAFIIRALGDFNPPPPALPRFSDVPPSNQFYAFIEQMALRQITLGCGSNIYCPAQNVTREQMAAFIIRALHAPGYVPAPPGAQRFADVPPTNSFYAHIEEMAVRGITLGCGGGNYCPSAFVTRGQMAAFLVRAFNL